MAFLAIPMVVQLVINNGLAVIVVAVEAAVVLIVVESVL